MTEEDLSDSENRDEQAADSLELTCPLCGTDHDSGLLGNRLDPRQAIEMCPGCGFEYDAPPVPVDQFEDLIQHLEEPPHPELSDKEVARRLPHLRLIGDPDLTKAVMELSKTAPAYFWYAPASTSGYHHPICRETHGLWAHTLMVATVIERLGDSYVEQGRLTRKEIDFARAAALLHDQRKKGPYQDPQHSSTSDHDLLMAEVAEEAGLDQRVVDAIASHMGPWYDGPSPAADLQDLVHTADMVASTNTITPKVQGPVPEELQEIGVEEADN